MNFREGYATYPADIEALHQGDWANPGVYCLHHLPTGLEYVGASVSVGKRLRQHLFRPDSWNNRLSACLIVEHFGPQIVEHHGIATLLFSPAQIQSVDSLSLAQALAALAQRGVCAKVRPSEILPIFLEKPRTLKSAGRASGLADAEQAQIAQRKPLLNKLRISGYGPSGPLCPGLGPPPRCLSDESVKAIARLFAADKMPVALQDAA